MAQQLTPDTTPEPVVDLQDDVWGDDSDNAGGNEQMLSDLPTIKRQHMTDGYREGLSFAKAKVMQEGFDNGYPLGIEIGLRVGQILGVLEGYLASRTVQSVPEMRAVVQPVYTEAKKELAITKLLRGVDERDITNTTTVPEAVSMVIKGWEGKVYGVWKALEQIQLVRYEQNGHAFRDMIAEKKREDAAPEFVQGAKGKKESLW